MEHIDPRRNKKGQWKKGIAPKNKTHNMDGTRPYNVWLSMRQRCLNPKSHAYKWYGGRGIKICEEWDSFIKFWDDMKGTYKSNLSLDRKDNSKGYSKENCHWVTMKEQNNNRRGNLLISFNGETKTMSQWADFLGVKLGTFHYRYHHWEFKKAMTTNGL